MDFFKKELTQPVSPMIHDAEMANLEARLKAKRIIFYLNYFLVFIWIVIGIMNVFAGKMGVALINFLCVIMWFVVARMNFIAFKDIKAKITQKVNEFNAIKAKQQDIESLNFFGKGQ